MCQLLLRCGNENQRVLGSFDKKIRKNTTQLTQFGYI